MKAKLLLIIFLFFCTLVMAQVNKTIESTAGQLNTLLSSTELSTITHLTVTGTMDARDFLTMKNEMPVLSVLDISKVRINEYEDDVYQANSIPNHSFYGNTSLTSIILPFSIVDIGWEVFLECVNLVKVTIPHQVKTIGQRAFNGCTSLTSIRCFAVQPPELGPETVMVFGQIDLTKCVLYVPEGSGELYAKASQWRDFENIIEMPGIKLSTSAITLEGQETTASLNILTALAWEASTDQSWLTVSPLSGNGNQQISFSAPENSSLTVRRATVVFSVSDTLQYEVTVAQKGLPVTVEMEAPGTFSEQLTPDQLSTLSELVITGPMDARDFKIIRDQTPLLEVLDLREASIEAYSGEEGTFPYQSPWDYAADELPDFALQDAWLTNRKVKLTTLYLPETCTSVGREALANCIGLTKVVVPPSVVYIDFMAFVNCISLKSVSLPSVTTIDANAFAECLALTDIHMPAVTDIGESAFEKCVKLLSVDPPNTLTRIRKRAFSMCYELTSVEIGNSLTRIDEEAFYECHNLRSIDIPESVTFIGIIAFYNCLNLQSVYAYAENPLDLTSSSSWSVFELVNKSTCILYVPYGAKELYEKAAQWEEFQNIVEMAQFTLEDTTVTLEAKDLSQTTVQLNSSLPWTATSDQEWLTIDPSSGSSGQLLTLTAEANLDTTRTATVTITADNRNPLVLTVTQKAITVGLDEWENQAQVTSYPNPFTTELVVAVANPSLKDVTAEIFSISGQKVRTLAKGLKGANISLQWNGTNEQGQQVPEGMYLLKVNGQVSKVVKR